MFGDQKGQEIGKIDVEIVPCDADGVALGEKAYTDDPNILIGAPFNFMVRSHYIHNA